MLQQHQLGEEGMERHKGSSCLCTGQVEGRLGVFQSQGPWVFIKVALLGGLRMARGASWAFLGARYREVQLQQQEQQQEQQQGQQQLVARKAA
jgi:hypothetical protein